MTRPAVAIRLAALVVILAVALIPLVATTLFTSQVGLTSLWLGLAAASLSRYGGMVSLAQTALFGVAGMISAKLVAEMGWNPWLAAVVGILVATVVGVVFGAVASGSQDIYFLIITLAFAQVTYYYFASVEMFGAHEGSTEYTGLSSSATRFPSRPECSTSCWHSPS